MTITEPSTHLESNIERYRINDTLTAALAMLGWESNTQEDDDFLDDLTHLVADNILPKEATETPAVPIKQTIKIDIIQNTRIMPPKAHTREQSTVGNCLTSADGYCHSHQKVCP